MVFSGFYDEQLGENGKLIDIDGNMPSKAKMANVTVYGPNGEDDVVNYLGYTMSSDPKLFGVLANGEYSVTRVSDVGPYSSPWTIGNRGQLPTPQTVLDFCWMAGSLLLSPEHRVPGYISNPK